MPGWHILPCRGTLSVTVSKLDGSNFPLQNMEFPEIFSVTEKDCYAGEQCLYIMRKRTT